MYENVQSLRVLVADDDPIFASLARSCLERAACTIDVVDDGAAALDALSQAHYDVALIDLAMPRIDGFRLIAMIRGTPHLETLPLIVMSSRNDVAAVEEAFHIGANAFETKPVNWALFPSKMRHLVRSNALLAALKAEVRQLTKAARAAAVHKT
ncbi:MAG: response regulator [Hyphomicrobium sp.]